MAKFIVHHRLLIQRGITFVAIFVSTMTAVGVWREYLPGIQWGWLWLFGGMLYLTIAWSIGWFDERFLWREETSKYSQRNPELMEILERVKNMESKINRHFYYDDIFTPWYSREYKAEYVEEIKEKQEQ